MQQHLENFKPSNPYMHDDINTYTKNGNRSLPLNPSIDTTSSKKDNSPSQAMSTLSTIRYTILGYNMECIQRNYRIFAMD